MLMVARIFFSAAFPSDCIHWVLRRSPRQLTQQGFAPVVLKFARISVISEECICQSGVQLEAQLSVQLDVFEA